MLANYQSQPIGCGTVVLESWKRTKYTLYMHLYYPLLSILSSCSRFQSIFCFPIVFAKTKWCSESFLNAYLFSMSFSIAVVVVVVVACQSPCCALKKKFLIFFWYIEIEYRRSLFSVCFRNGLVVLCCDGIGQWSREKTGFVCDFCFFCSFSSNVACKWMWVYKIPREKIGRVVVGLF